MRNETRNILLGILSLAKHEEEKEYYLDELLLRCELMLKDELEQLNRQTEEIECNLELLEYVKNQIKKGE